MSGIYKHILVAVDLHPACDRATIAHAREVANQQNAKLTIVHAVEHINAYGIAQAYPAVLDLEAQMLKEARLALSKLCDELGIKDPQLIVEIGSPKIIILDAAANNATDLIVVGSHGRHGISVLLGSTANAILHNAPCDVLAVRLKD